MKPASVLLLGLFLSGCGQGPGASAEQNEPEPAPTSRLEQAAIEAGVIPDIRNVTLSGAFERQSELGIDRFCAVGNDERGYQVGMLAVFGPESKCEGLGEAQRTGETISITLDSKETCRFDASFDGVELQLPGDLPEACLSYCSPRATLNGVSFFLVGEGDAVARSTQGREIESLCPGG
ncbi:hypothetical protein [Parasphingorhabdus sp.]|uniref:hypothetical protein n=2 Tax=Parasphingorhabdus sp. TaxID=2709688 RepID=UPI00326604EE